MESFDAGVLSLLPPLLAVTLALLTREVLSSLIAGILCGTIIYCAGTDNAGGVLLGSVDVAFKEMVKKFDLNIVIFCSLLGALVSVINRSGGVRDYGRWAASRIRSRRSAMLSTSVLGAFIFIDDYFNCLTVGTVMRPVTDSYRISRQKLAFLIDSTAAPVCIIAPISSWAAAIGSNLRDTNAFDNEISAFISTVPWNFYALLCLMTVFLVAFCSFDFGPMRAAEQRCISHGTLPAETTSPADNLERAEGRGTLLDMLIPLLSLIFCATGALLYVGGYWGDDPQYHSVAAALGNTDAGPALVLGSFGGLLTAFVLYLSRHLMGVRTFMEAVSRGIQTMLPACLILTLAWTISGVCRDLLQTPEFISGLFASSGRTIGAIMPAAVFAIAGFLSFATGTAWGTFGILIPIVVPVAQGIDPESSQLTVIALSATLAGSVFGDHCSPISDTTILSSAGAGCIHIDHVTTQLPYSLTVAGCSLCGYLVAGLTYSLTMSLGTCIVLLCGGFFWLHLRSRRALANDAPA